MSRAAPSTGDAAARLRDPVLWHDIECGGYRADLALWEELTADASELLELGCGTGRVALHLARGGNEVQGVDRDAALVAALNRAADSAGVPARATVADAREMALDDRFPLILAPMQLFQVLGGARGRRSALQRVGGHLAEDGILAAAIVDFLPGGEVDEDSLPDVRDVDGWIHSSLPLEVRMTEGPIEIRRVRQVVSPAGELAEEAHVIRLDRITASTLEAEGSSVGLEPCGRRSIPATESHVGSTVVLLGRG